MIAIIDYEAGNLRSVANAFEALGERVKVTNNAREISEAAAIVLPGVGAFGDGMNSLRKSNLIDVLNEQVLHRQKPYLGICLGMQFLAARSDEHGMHEGLGWVDASVGKIKPIGDEYRVPHIGWNTVTIQRPSDLFDGIEGEPVFYFLHSWSLQSSSQDPDLVTSSCWHGVTVTASIQKGNIHGVQFHPEKSQKTGLKLLDNFRKLL